MLLKRNLEVAFQLLAGVAYIAFGNEILNLETFSFLSNE